MDWSLDSLFDETANDFSQAAGNNTGMDIAVLEAVKATQKPPRGVLAPTEDIETPNYQVNNLVASVHLACMLDLRIIAATVRTAEYNPRKVNAVIFRLRNLKVTALVFRSGRVLLMGSNSLADTKKAAKIIAKVAIKAGHAKVRFCGFRVESLVAHAHCGFPIRLEDLAREHFDFCTFEPELSCSLCYRYHPSDALKASILVFVSGRIIITGCKSEEDVKSVLTDVFPLLANFRSQRADENL